MQRISIVGCPGAGKSTFAVALGKVLGLDVLPIDLIFWATDFRERSRAEQEVALAQALQRPGCILEGGFPWTYAERLAASDMLIWLDIQPHVRLYQMLKRHWSRRERIGQYKMDAMTRKRLSRAHAPSAVLRQQRDHARHLEPLFAAPPEGRRLVRLQSPAAAQAFLHALRK